MSSDGVTFYIGDDVIIPTPIVPSRPMTDSFSQHPMFLMSPQQQQEPVVVEKKSTKCKHCKHRKHEEKKKKCFFTSAILIFKHYAQLLAFVLFYVTYLKDLKWEENKISTGLGIVALIAIALIL